MASLLKRLSQRSNSGSSKSKMVGNAIKDFNNMSADAKAYFNEVAQLPFSQQAVAFLNAYWEEVSDQAEFIFSVAWETMKLADMHTKGVSLIHLYEEGVVVDFNVGLYFYEKLCKFVLESDEGRKWRNDPKYKVSMPEMMTAIVRKKELRDKVDVNFDGKISFLEYLLYQYRDITNPAEFTRRAMIITSGGKETEDPRVTAARLALDEVNEKIRAYEMEKARLTELSKQSGVKGLGAKHQLTMLVSSPIAEELQVALIKAEAAVRAAVRATKAGNSVSASQDGPQAGANPGALWWMNRDLEEKKKRYGR